MIVNGLLWSPHPGLMLERVGGLTVLERQATTASRAGLKRLWVAAAAPDAKTLERLRLPAGLEVRWVSKDSDAPVDCEPPYVGLSGEHFMRVETLRHVLGQDYRSHAALQDPEGNAVIQVVPFRWDRSVAYQKQPMPQGSSIRLESPASQGPALGWLLTTGPKAGDGFMARHFDRHLSLAVSRLLLDTPVTPNVMTILSCLIGLAGAACFLQHSRAAHLAGAGLVWLHSVLDGCDGELARIRFQESPLGAAIDFWGDNLVHVALFSCLAWGFYQADKSPLPLALGAAAVLATAGSAALAYMAKLEGKGPVAPGAAEEGFLARISTLLAQRDFIYLLLFLAYIGRTYEFLWAAAIGSMLFFAAMMSLSTPRRFQREQA